MTTVCVLADPPRPGLVLPDLVATSPLTADEAAAIYRAMLADSLRAAEQSGGELLVNYRPDESLPDGADGPDADGPDADDSEAAVRTVAEDALERPDEARFERQVGETFAGRAGNTVTHLLEQEDAGTAAVVEPTAAFLSRVQIDEAAMKLRSSPVVIGPAGGGRVYYAGFGATVDFENAWATPAVETLTARGRDASHDVDFLSMLPVVERGSDLADAVALLRARERAGRPVPERLAGTVDDLGLSVEADDENQEGLRLVR